MDRLRKQFEIMSICPGSLKQIGSRSLSGKKQNLASRTELPQCNRKLNPGKFWHYDIRNEQFRGLLFGSQKRFQRIRKRDRVEPASLQNRRQSRRDDELVIDYENTEWCTRFGHGNPPWNDVLAIISEVIIIAGPRQINIDVDCHSEPILLYLEAYVRNRTEHSLFGKQAVSHQTAFCS